MDVKVNSLEDPAYKYLEQVIPERENGKKVIDYLVITHPDRDHLEGIDL